MDFGICFGGDSESIHRCRPFPVHVTAAKGEKQGEEEEGKGQEVKEEEEITPVYNREVLGAVFDGTAVS